MKRAPRSGSRTQNSSGQGCAAAALALAFCRDGLAQCPRTSFRAGAAGVESSSRCRRRICRFRRGQDPLCQPGTQGRSSGRDDPRLPRLLVFLARPDARAREALPRRGDRPARLQPERSARGCRELHDRQAGRRRGRGGQALRCRQGCDRRTRLGRTGGVDLRHDSPRDDRQARRAQPTAPARALARAGDQPRATEEQPVRPQTSRSPTRPNTFRSSSSPVGSKTPKRRRSISPHSSDRHWKECSTTTRQTTRAFPKMPQDDKAAMPAIPDFPAVKCSVLLIHGLKDQALLPGALNDTWKWIDNDLTLVTIPAPTISSSKMPPSWSPRRSPVGSRGSVRRAYTLNSPRKTRPSLTVGRSGRPWCLKTSRE